MKAPWQLRTKRLVLTTPDPGDTAAIFERYASDPEVTRYLSWPRHRSMADTTAFLQFSAQEWARWPAGPYLIRARREDRLLGSTGLGFEAPDRASTGYVLAKDAWGMGYATEALAAIVSLASELGVTHLHAACHAEHHASARVMEKCGFDRDHGWTQRAEFPNLVPGVPQEVACYVIVPGEPRTRSP
jgi:[ribosomal protein S5]-alanine N-acetyltransferase